MQILLSDPEPPIGELTWFTILTKASIRHSIAQIPMISHHACRTIPLLWFSLLCIPTFAVFASGALYLDDDQKAEKTSTPHPWLATAPGEYLRLINRGKVNIQINDSILATYRKAALTRFEIKLDYKCIFRPPKSTTKNGNPIRLLDVRYTKRDLSLQHVIIISANYQPNEPWQDRLMKHEMDHVAITTDPRLQDLVRGLFSRGFTIEVEPNSERGGGTSDFQSQIDQFTSDVIKEMETLLQHQYDELDRFSQDGLAELEDREQFFLSLYDFDACKPHLPKALSQVNQDQWKKWVKIDSKTLAAHYSLSR